MEGALFGAAALRMLGYPPLLLDLEAVHDDDHVLAVFRTRGCWGAVAKSNFSGLRYREPVYRTLRELVMSYFEHYYNLRREKTLRNYSRPVNLRRFDRIGWMTAEEDVWAIPEYLCTIRHTPVMPSRLVPHLGAWTHDSSRQASGVVDKLQRASPFIHGDGAPLFPAWKRASYVQAKARLTSRLRTPAGHCPAARPCWRSRNSRRACRRPPSVRCR
jgi:hypothetical protein